MRLLGRSKEWVILYDLFARFRAKHVPNVATLGLWLISTSKMASVEYI